MNASEARVEPVASDFTLQARHVGLLTVFILTFREYDGKLPPQFLLHLLRLLLIEVSEVASPRSYTEILQDLQAAPRAEDPVAAELITAFQACRDGLRSIEQLTNFFAGLPSLFVEKGENEDDPSSNSILHRRSVFGFFCRRCFVSFLKLSFNGVGKLLKEYDAWFLGLPVEDHEFPTGRDGLSSDSHIYRTVADKTLSAQPEPYAKWEQAFAAGAEHNAVENLRQYFEQHFHQNNDSGFRQHALLNLVRMHYMREEYTAARKLLSEAIGAARASNDKITLAHCIAMTQRLPPTLERRRPGLLQIEADIHPLEILFDVSKLMDEENGQPLSASFEKIFQAVGLYDHWNDTQPVAPAETEQWAQHTVQSVVWSAAGCDRLAAIEENLVIAFTEVGGRDNNRITVILNQAYREARQGNYEKSLCALLNPAVWSRLSIIEYGQWAHEIWHILALWASRRGQERVFREVLMNRRPAGDFKPRMYSLNALGFKLSKINEPLWETIQLRHCDQAASSMDGLLTSLWHSEFLGRLNPYRTGITLLADVGLEYGMTKRSRKILEEIMPQIIAGNDLEQRGLACFILARCIIVSEEGPGGLEKAVRYLEMAEADYKTLSMHEAVMDVQYYLAVVYENLGRRADSEAAGRRHFETEKIRDEFEGSGEEFGQVLSVVRHVGSILAAPGL